MLITSTTIQSEVDRKRQLVISRNDDERPNQPADVLVEWKRHDGMTGPLMVFDPTEPDEIQFEKADCLAAEIWGRDRRGRANATNSMVHDVWRLLQQVAGA